MRTLAAPICEPCWERARRVHPVYRLGMCRPCFSGRAVLKREEDGFRPDERNAAYQRRYRRMHTRRTREEITLDREGSN